MVGECAAAQLAGVAGALPVVRRFHWLALPACGVRGRILVGVHLLADRKSLRRRRSGVDQSARPHRESCSRLRNDAACVAPRWPCGSGCRASLAPQFPYLSWHSSWLGLLDRQPRAIMAVRWRSWKPSNLRRETRLPTAEQAHRGARRRRPDPSHPLDLLAHPPPRRHRPGRCKADGHAGGVARPAGRDAGVSDWCAAGLCGGNRNSSGPSIAAFRRYTGPDQATPGYIPLHWRNHQQPLGPADPRSLPALVRTVLMHHYCWVCGGAAFDETALALATSGSLRIFFASFPCLLSGSNSITLR